MKFKIFFILIISGAAMNMMAQSQLPTRDKIDDKYKWNLKDLFATDRVWDDEFNSISGKIKILASYSGKIAKSAKSLKDCSLFMMELDKRFSKLAMYAYLGKDIDLTNEKFQIMFGKIQQLTSDYSAAASFYTPEVASLNEKKMEEFYKAEPKLKEFKFKFDQIFRMRSHTLPAEQEALLAKLSPVFSIARNTYSTLNDADLPFPKIKDPEGNEVELSHGRYRAGLYSQDRNYRRDVYLGNYVPYKQLKNTFANLYNGRVQQRITMAKIKNYSSAVESAMYDNNIPVSVYENLVKVTNDNVKTQHRWAELKKKVLKLDELHPYDTYVSLFPSVSKKYSYDEAVEICIKALEPLGKDYIDAMKIGFANRWIDVYETKAKRSGAYSNSTGTGPHPFILLNWNNTLDDLFTLIHELGHNMHSYFTEKNQPFIYTDYATFVAEVASTANEALLIEYLLKNAQTKEEKLALYEKFLTNVQTTLFRQTHFAEFEKTIHEKAEKGEFLTADQLTNVFGDMYKKYWGTALVMDAEEGLSWARIPHLYNYNFYVYQYSTGMSAAQALVDNIKKDGKPAIDRYLKFLSSGSSDYPIEILKKAGVDMSKPDAIQSLINKANQYLDEMELLLK